MHLRNRIALGIDNDVVVWVWVLRHTISGGLEFWQILAMVMLKIIQSPLGLGQIRRAGQMFIPKTDPRIDLIFFPTFSDTTNLTRHF